MPRLTSEIRHNTLLVAAHEDLGEFESNSIDAEGDVILEQLDDPQLRNVVMDLSGSDYYGSSALNLFLRIEKKISGRGGRLLLVGLSPHELEILHVTRLYGRWTICKNREAALRILGNAPQPIEQ